MNVNQFDIVLDVLVVNQTADTLQNLTLELATLGKMPSLQNRTLHFWKSDFGTKPECYYIDGAFTKNFKV